MKSLSGYILAATSGQELTRELFEPSPGNNQGIPSLKFGGHAFGLHQWDQFVLTTDVALADEELSESPNPPYRYKIILIKGVSKVVVLAERRRIADFVVAKVLDRIIFPNLRRASIYLDPLIRSCSDSSCEFLITSLQGRHSGTGRQLRVMSLYGDDVTDSTIFRDNAGFFNFFSCGIGRRLYEGLPKLRPNEEGEIVRIGNEGFLTLYVSDQKRALEFLRVLRFVISNRWIDPFVGFETDL